MRRPPLAQALREIGAAGQRRVVGAGPAAERDLHDQQDQADPQQRDAASARPPAPGRCRASRARPARSAARTSVRPPSRCPITTTGLSSQVTVHMPSRAWNTITISVTAASARGIAVGPAHAPTSRISFAGQRQHRRRDVVLPDVQRDRGANQRRANDDAAQCQAAPARGEQASTSTSRPRLAARCRWNCSRQALCGFDRALEGGVGLGDLMLAASAMRRGRSRSASPGNSGRRWTGARRRRTR